MSFSTINRLMVLPCVAQHFKACLMGPKPSSLHGREVEWEGFGVQWVLQSSWTSGSNQRGDGGWMDGGGRVKRGPEEGDRWGEKEQEKVIKGGKDKANWAGRSDNSFVMTPLNGSRNLWEWRGKLTNANVKSQIVLFYLTVTSVSGDWQARRCCWINIQWFGSVSGIWGRWASPMF